MGFTAAQAARLSGCTTTRLDAWRRIGLVVPEQRGAYAFRDLVVLRMVGALLDEGVPMARVRRAVRALVEAGDDIAALSLVSEGDTVFACRDDGQVLDALRHGQLALFVSVGRLVEEVDADVRTFDDERRSFVARLSAEA
jgi:DNA-binding transcriptional MerR regulator